MIMRILIRDELAPLKSISEEGNAHLSSWMGGKGKGKDKYKDNEGAKLNHKKLFVLLDETSSISNGCKLWIILSKLNPLFFHFGNLFAKLKFRNDLFAYFE